MVCTAPDARWSGPSLQLAQWPRRGSQALDCSQLLVEAVHLLGSLLLLLDRRLGSPIRERIVVAYFRLKGGAQVLPWPAPGLIPSSFAVTKDDSVRAANPSPYASSLLSPVPTKRGMCRHPC